MFRAFRFDPEKSIQAVAFLLRREPHRCMNYMRLLKVLYIAEREIIAESGKPLTGSPVVAMKRGPVLQDVYDLIRSQHASTPIWSRYFQVEHFHLEMIDDPGIGKLSRFVTRKLEEVAVRHQNDDEWAMVEFTHKLPEWVKNDPGESSKWISLEDILESVGRKQDLNEIVRGTKDDEFARKLFETTEPLYDIAVQ